VSINIVTVAPNCAFRVPKHARAHSFLVDAYVSVVV